MVRMVSWKMFLTQLDKKTNAEFLIYGDIFPSMMFCLPEQAQASIEVNAPVKFALPKGSLGLAGLFEALPSVVDIAHGNREYETKVGLKSAVVDNEEVNGDTVELDPSETMGAVSVYRNRFDLNTNTKIKPSPTLYKKSLFRKHIKYSWEFQGRYNKKPIDIHIEKWDLSINEMIDVIYNNAKHSSFIPLHHTKEGIFIPEKFKDRHIMALDSKIIKFKSYQFPNIQVAGGISKWINVSEQTTKNS